MNLSELASSLKPFIVRWFEAGGAIGKGFAPSPHDISSGHHTGQLSDAQAPQFLKADGTRQLTGNLPVMAGVTLDGVDLSTFKNDFDVHLTGDSHTDYVHKTIARVITAVHTFNPGSAGAPFALGVNAQGQVVTGLRADELNKSIIAGNGLSGGGLLTADRTLSLNTGANITWTGQHNFTFPVISGGLLPYMPDTFDIGSSSNFWRKAWISELDAVIFSKETVSIIGGWLLLSKGEGYIRTDVLDTDTAIDFGQTMTPNDFVLIRSAGKVEYIKVGASVGTNVYNVTRNLDGSGANDWSTGTPYVILGNSGNGRIELNAYDSPRMSIIKQGSAYNTQTELVRIGDLNGNWGYLTETYGAAFGDFQSGLANITIDPTYGVRLRIGNTDIITLSASEAVIKNVLKMPDTTSALAIGATPPSSASSGTGLWIDRTGLHSLAGSLEQSRIDAVTGEIIAGYDSVFSVGDIVKIGRSGVKIKAHEVSFFGSEGYPSTYGIGFTDSGNAGQGRAFLHAAKSDNERILVIGNAHETGKIASINLLAGYGLPGDEFASVVIQSGPPGLANNFVSIGPAIKIGDQFLSGADGWQFANENWKYVSATTFRVSGDVRTKYPQGTKLKLTQTSVKYFYVVATSYSSPNTTITVTAGSDYTLANADITGNYLSYANTPQGFPNAFNYVPSWTSDGTQPSIGNGVRVGRFTIIGKTVHCRIKLVTGSTTTYGTGLWKFSIPVPDRYEMYMLGVARFYDYSTTVMYHGFSSVLPSAGTMIAFNSVSPSSAIGPTIPFTWAASDELFINISYEMA